MPPGGWGRESVWSVLGVEADTASGGTVFWRLRRCVRCAHGCRGRSAPPPLASSLRSSGPTPALPHSLPHPQGTASLPRSARALDRGAPGSGVAALCGQEQHLPGPQAGVGWWLRAAGDPRTGGGPPGSGSQGGPPRLRCPRARSEGCAERGPRLRGGVARAPPAREVLRTEDTMAEADCGICDSLGYRTCDKCGDVAFERGPLVDLCANCR